MPSETTSPTLLARVGNPADSGAWREFDARYGELILRYCRGWGLQHADADDIRQIVMVRLARALPGFRYEPRRGRFRAWLGRIVRNELIRAAGRPRPPASGVDIDEPSDPAPEDWEREWMHHHLRLAMQTLRAGFEARSLEVFERLLSGQSVEHVAAAFEMSTQAVHKVKQRICHRLQTIVADQIRDEERMHEQIG